MTGQRYSKYHKLLEARFAHTVQPQQIFHGLFPPEYWCIILVYDEGHRSSPLWPNGEDKAGSNKIIGV